MKLFKILLGVIIGIIALVLVVGLFVNGKYAVEREVSINKPLAEVFDYVKYLKNQDNFAVWSNMDPDMKKEFRGVDGTAGFVSAWESQNPDVGKGEQEIIKITDGERIDYELRFLEPFESTDQAYMITTAVNDSTTQVKWGFYGEMSYPMNLMLLTMDMEKVLGNDLQKGLNLLKKILETSDDPDAVAQDTAAE